MVEEGWGDDGLLCDRRVVLLVEARRLPAAEVHHKPSDQVVAESGVVDHVDEEAVRDCVDTLNLHCYGYGSARGLALIEARDHPSRDGEQGRGGGMPLFEAMLGGVSAHRLHDVQEDESLQYLHFRAEQWDGA